MKTAPFQLLGLSNIHFGKETRQDLNLNELEHSACSHSESVSDAARKRQIGIIRTMTPATIVETTCFFSVADATWSLTVGLLASSVSQIHSKDRSRQSNVGTARDGLSRSGKAAATHATNILEDKAKKDHISMTDAEKKRKGYPENWEHIARALKEKHGWKCERCGAPHNPAIGRCLTIHHLDGNPRNNTEWNLACLDQACHLAIQGRVKMDQLFFLEVLPVSGWFKPHYDGYLESLKKHEMDSSAIQ